VKFIRRKELDSATRTQIVILALSCQGIYGARTALANEYNLSRSFLYQLINAALLCLDMLFKTANTAPSTPLLSLDFTIALLRLEGKVSIGSISAILQMQGYQYSATGLISERLKHWGAQLPSTLSTHIGHKLFILADELFVGSLPILVTLDPVSTAIIRIELADNRNADTWQAHFEGIQAQNFELTGMSSDRGSGLVKGYQSAHSDAVWCSDHFHEFRGLTELCAKLENKAYAAIAHEQARIEVFNNARSEENLKKRLHQVEQAMIVCENNINNYQYVRDVLDMLFPSLYFFNLNTGEPQYAVQVKTELLLLMDLLDELELKSMSEQTKKIRLHIDDICNCYQQVETLYQHLNKAFHSDTLNIACLAWQHQHQSHQHKGVFKKYHLAKSDFWREMAAQQLEEKHNQPDTVDNQIDYIFEQLNTMVRSSSLVEMINSLIAPYLDSSKGQITQVHFNLIMFYHNHRLYKSGKRQGSAPIELLTNKKLEKNWLEILFDTVTHK